MDELTVILMAIAHKSLSEIEQDLRLLDFMPGAAPKTIRAIAIGAKLIAIHLLAQQAVSTKNYIQ